MSKKEMVNIHKTPDGIWEFETFEKPLRTQIAELKQQLAEKEKLIRKYATTSCPIHQDKISFAIAELEKVKEHFINIKTPTLGVIRRAEMVMYIDNQINGLKGDEVVCFLEDII